MIDIETITRATVAVADRIWAPMAYVVLGLGLAYTIGTKAVQFRRVPDMVRQLRDSTGGDGGMSSFQALAMALASRVGVGSIAGVATAIGGGGPGALFWMAITGLLGCTVGYAEACLAQTYKRQVEDEDLKAAKEDIGGMPYYIRYGLPWPKIGAVVGALIAVMGLIGYGLIFPGLQVSTIAGSWELAFHLPRWVPAVVVTLLIAMVIFGGTVRLVKVTQVLVPVLAFGYLGLAIAVIGVNFASIPDAISLIARSAFGMEPVLAGIAGAAVAWGATRRVCLLQRSRRGDVLGGRCAYLAPWQAGARADLLGLHRHPADLHGQWPHDGGFWEVQRLES